MIFSWFEIIHKKGDETFLIMNLKTLVHTVKYRYNMKAHYLYLTEEYSRYINIAHWMKYLIQPKRNINSYFPISINHRKALCELTTEHIT